MNCRLLLLQDGTMVLGEIDTEHIDYSVYTQELVNPVKIEPFQVQQGSMVYESYMMKSWLPMMAGNSVLIQTAKIVTAIQMNEKYEEQYRLYIGSKEQTSDEEASLASKDTFNPFSSEHNQEGSSLSEANDDFSQDEDEVYYDPREQASKRTLH